SCGISHLSITTHYTYTHTHTHTHIYIQTHIHIYTHTHTHTHTYTHTHTHTHRYTHTHTHTHVSSLSCKSIPPAAQVSLSGDCRHCFLTCCSLGALSEQRWLSIICNYTPLSSILLPL